MELGQGSLTALRVSSFQGLQNLPLFVAQREGYFAAEGLDMQLSYTTGSAVQLAGLVRGEFELVQTAPDNVINADTRPAAFGLGPAEAPRIVMLMGSSVGPLSIYARPGMASVEQLRGTALGVDNPGSGFALVLRDLLLRRGLELDRDYTFLVAGGTHARCDSLLRGDIAATILYPPFDLRAADGGCRRLASSTEAYVSYASGCTAARQDWIEAHPDAVTGYIRALLCALRWLHEPTNAQTAQALIRSDPALGVPHHLVPRAYAAVVSLETGVRHDGALDEPGLRQVIALRAAYGPPDVRLGEPEEYCDSRWLRRAQAGETPTS
jgi:ABC-type nitrate/sulfonate/bicarbonate transport system substrate-binding protein